MVTGPLGTGYWLLVVGYRLNGELNYQLPFTSCHSLITIHQLIIDFEKAAVTIALNGK